jgi:hypothetical protein
MNVDVLMVTFRRDLEFAEYSFRSVSKFATGFANKIVVVPEPDGDLFREIAEPNGFTVLTFEEWPGKGFLHHEALICEADKWCPHADAILHLDADCLFTAPVSASDYFVDGRPILYCQRFEEFRQYTSRYSWKQCVREATGIDPEWETMCRHPAVHLKEAYRLTREAIAAHTKMDWKDYIRSCRNVFPQTFAEFPTLGAVVIERCPNHYLFIEAFRDRPNSIFSKEDLSIEDKSMNKLRAFWSVGGVEMINDRHPDETARQVMERILAS